MIDFEVYGNPLTADLGKAKPKPTSVEGQQLEAAKPLWKCPDGRTEVGIWECTAGRFTADRSATSEICHLLTGRATISSPDGTEREVRSGDVFTLPKGWVGEWVIHETTRKIYVLTA